MIKNEAFDNFKIYNSVNDMKLDTTLVTGDFCITKGYYSSGDGGHAKYEIKNSGFDKILWKKRIPDDGYCHLLDNGLHAVLILDEHFITPEQFGCIGYDYTSLFQNYTAQPRSSIFDSTEQMTKAINLCSTASQYAKHTLALKLKAKIYFIGNMEIDSQCHLLGTIGTEFHYIGDTVEGSFILKCKKSAIGEISNILFVGCSKLILGDQECVAEYAIIIDEMDETFRIQNVQFIYFLKSALLIRMFYNAHFYNLRFDAINGYAITCSSVYFSLSITGFTVDYIIRNNVKFANYIASINKVSGKCGLGFMKLMFGGGNPCISVENGRVEGMSALMPDPVDGVKSSIRLVGGGMNLTTNNIQLQLHNDIAFIHDEVGNCYIHDFGCHHTNTYISRPISITGGNIIQTNRYGDDYSTIHLIEPPSTNWGKYGINWNGRKISQSVSLSAFKNTNNYFTFGDIVLRSLNCKGEDRDAMTDCIGWICTFPRTGLGIISNRNLNAIETTINTTNSSNTLISNEFKVNFSYTFKYDDGSIFYNRCIAINNDEVVFEKVFKKTEDNVIFYQTEVIFEPFGKIQPDVYTSPNGTKYKLTVNDLGEIITIQI